jgi:hypothetical protein
MDPEVVLVTNAFGFVGTLCTLIYQGWERGRERRWDAEDRLRLHAENQQKSIELGTQIGHATEVAKAAYQEANSINLKIVAALRTPRIADVAKTAEVAEVAKVAQVAEVAKVAQVAEVARVADIAELAKLADVARTLQGSEPDA